VACRDVKAGEELLRLPAGALVGPLEAEAALGGRLPPLEPWVGLALFLIRERNRARGSPLADYIEELDGAGAGGAGAGLGSPLAWSEAEMGRLAGTQAGGLCAGYLTFLEQQWAQLQPALDADRDFFPPDVFTLEAFRWAFAAVRSQLVPPCDGGADTALVPAAALLGHSGRSTARLAWKGKGLFGGGERALCLNADRPYRAGEPVEMNFGGEDKIDPQVLLDHGLWDRASFCGGYALQLNLPEGDSYDDKVDTLELNGLSVSQTFPLREGEPMPPELVAFLRLVNLGGEDAWLLEPVFRETLWKEVLMFPVSEANEQSVCDSMTAYCRGLLSQYPPPIPGAGEGPRAEAAASVATGELAALQGALDYFEGQRRRLPQLEYYQERRLRSLNLLDDDGESTYGTRPEDDPFFVAGQALDKLQG